MLKKYPSVVEPLYLKTKCNAILNLCCEQLYGKNWDHEDIAAIYQKIKIKVMNAARVDHNDIRYGVQLFGYDFSNYVRFTLVQLLSRHIKLNEYLSVDFLGPAADVDGYISPKAAGAMVPTNISRYAIGSTLLQNEMESIWSLILNRKEIVFTPLLISLLLNHIANAGSLSTNLLWRYLIYQLNVRVSLIKVGFIQFSPLVFDPPEFLEEGFSISDTLFRVESKLKDILRREPHLKRELISEHNNRQLVFTEIEWKELLDLTILFREVTLRTLDISCAVVVERVMNDLTTDFELLIEEYKHFFNVTISISGDLPEYNPVEMVVGYLEGNVPIEKGKAACEHLLSSPNRPNSGKQRVRDLFEKVCALEMHLNIHVEMMDLLDYLCDFVDFEFVTQQWTYLNPLPSLCSYAILLSFEKIWKDLKQKIYKNILVHTGNRPLNTPILIVPETCNILRLVNEFDALGMLEERGILVKPAMVTHDVLNELNAMLLISNDMLPNHRARLERCTVDKVADFPLEPYGPESSLHHNLLNTLTGLEMLNIWFSPVHPLHGEELENHMKNLQEMLCNVGILARFDPDIFENIHAATIGGWFTKVFGYLTDEYEADAKKIEYSFLYDSDTLME